MSLFAHIWNGTFNCWQPMILSFSPLEISVRMSTVASPTSGELPATSAALTVLLSLAGAVTDSPYLP